MSLLNTFFEVRTIFVKVKTFTAKGSKNAPMFFTCEFIINNETVDKTAIIRVNAVEKRFVNDGGNPTSRTSRYYTHEIYKNACKQIYDYLISNKYVSDNGLEIANSWNDHYKLREFFMKKKISYSDDFIKVRNKQEL
jgi:hypothetical protein